MTLQTKTRGGRTLAAGLLLALVPPMFAGAAEPSTAGTARISDASRSNSPAIQPVGHRIGRGLFGCRNCEAYGGYGMPYGGLYGGGYPAGPYGAADLGYADDDFAEGEFFDDGFEEDGKLAKWLRKHGPKKVCIGPGPAFPQPLTSPVFYSGNMYQNYWPNAWTGRGGMAPATYPIVYQPTDTTQLGFYYTHVPYWYSQPWRVPGYLPHWPVGNVAWAYPKRVPLPLPPVDAVVPPPVIVPAPGTVAAPGELVPVPEADLGSAE